MRRSRFILLGLLLLSTMQAAAVEFSFTTCQDASGNVRHLDCIRAQDQTNTWKYGDGILVNNGGGVDRYFVRNATTGLGTTGDLTLFMAFRLGTSGGTNNHVLTHGYTGGDLLGNPDFRINYALQRVNNNFDYRHFGDSGNFFCTVTNAFTGPTQDSTAWIRRSGTSVTVKVINADGSTATNTCSFAANPPTGGSQGRFFSGVGWVVGSPTPSFTTLSFNQWYELRIWHSALDTGLLDDLADHDSTTGGTNKLIGGEVAFYNFENATITFADEPVAPSEFSNGLVAFATSIGFQTPESLMLFSLILIGLVTVITGISLKLMTSSRTKNLVIAGSGVLIAIFCVVLLLLDLWMLLVALVLGYTVAFGGVQETKNTLRDAKAFIESTFGPRARNVSESRTVENVESTAESVPVEGEADEA